MSIKLNTVAELQAEKVKRTRGDILTDADYVLRDKKKESKEGKSSKNTRDITMSTNKYAEEIARVKAEARREVEAEFTSSGFIDKLKADIKKELQEEAEAKPKGK